jgi:hypothetical protein
VVVPRMQTSCLQVNHRERSHPISLSDGTREVHRSYGHTDSPTAGGQIPIPKWRSLAVVVRPSPANESNATRRGRMLDPPVPRLPQLRGHRVHPGHPQHRPPGTSSPNAEWLISTWCLCAGGPP